ncbi:glycosyltransferase [Planktomarina temperata]|nr:glycosyltransferase [Planktomarina temperata]
MKVGADNDFTRISVVMAVCSKDDPKDLSEAISSIFESPALNVEVVLIGDGALSSELYRVVAEFKKNNANFIYDEMLKRSGPAKAWNRGIDAASGDLIYRMDADDLMRPSTLDTLRNFLYCNPDIALVGGKIEEFKKCPGDLGRIRSVPLSHEDILKKMDFGNPFNHVTVMFRKRSIGVVRYEQINGFVDYLFWLKLRKQKLCFANLDAILVDVRIGNGFLQRRRGLEYALSELSFAVLCVRRGLLPFRSLLVYVLVRFPIRLLPRKLLNFIYGVVRN